MSNLPKWLDAAEERCAEAAPGPWHIGWVNEPREDADDETADIDDVNGHNVCQAAWHRDQQFIIGARTDLPRALRPLRAALKVVEAARFMTECFSEEWCRVHVKNDHVCEMDHKDEMMVAEGTAGIRTALRAFDEEATR